MLKKEIKDAGGNGDGNNGNGNGNGGSCETELSSDKSVKVTGEGGVKVEFETEGCLSEIAVTNYQSEILDNMATVTWDITAVIDLENKVKIEVDEAKINGVEEISEVV
jgi:hypothetical protein